MDLDRLRRAADTRPGYATYPSTEPGSPSWWSRPGEECVLVVRQGVGMVCVHADHRHPQTWPAPAMPAPPPAAPATADNQTGAPGKLDPERLAEALTAALTTPRRRWWHWFRRASR
ncbi:hypothetical protein ACIBJE_02190 [Micromonospora sp. NPDC050187]|uniref:hypothetical protein n=1 Tax=Micromonospora sp. NPDC050187 TaxID=3364277 RepID=UPI0037AC5635